VSRIEGDALALVQRWLDLPSSTLTGVTEFDDGNASQVLDVAPAIRRGLTPVASSGLYIAVMENVHSGADSEASTVDPYNLGSALVLGGYPAAVDASLFDVWLLEVSCVRTSGAADLLVGQLRLNTTAGIRNPQGWGIDDAGALVTGTDGPVLAMWIGAVASSGSGSQACFVQAGTGKADAIRVNRRIRLGESLVFSTGSDAAMELQLIMTIGLFPAGLGQDILG